jgi:hypothetical protein
LAELQRRIEHLEKKGWHENAKACAEELKRLRALKGCEWLDCFLITTAANLTLLLA